MLPCIRTLGQNPVARGKNVNHVAFIFPPRNIVWLFVNLWDEERSSEPLNRMGVRSISWPVKIRPLVAHRL
jgi:hypothetical protein